MTEYQTEGGRGQGGEYGTEKAQGKSKSVRELTQENEQLKLQLKDAANQKWDAHTRKTELEADVRKLIDTNATLVAKQQKVLAELVQVIHELRSSVAPLPELLQLVWQHEEDFRKQKADATQRRQDIGSERHRTVGDVWDEFHELYKRVHGLASTLNKQLESDPVEERRPKAKLVHDMMVVLFPSGAADSCGPSDLEALLGQRKLPIDRPILAELTDAASTIHAAAAELGVTYLWTVDAAWIANNREQIEFWADCDEAAPPAFVVRPAFTANGKVIGTMILFSSRRSERASDLGGTDISTVPASDHA